MRSLRFFTILQASIIITIICVSCASRQIREHLADIESYIDSRPDSALAAIRQIDTAALRGRAVKAKYALLHAIALDKNYIDTADTRIVQPAVTSARSNTTPDATTRRSSRSARPPNSQIKSRTKTFWESSTQGWPTRSR